MKLAIFYHCYLFSGDPPELLPNAYLVVSDQMRRLQASGLADAADEIIVGINGGIESRIAVGQVVPFKTTIFEHGLESKCENPTLVLLERWLTRHPEEAYVLYFHAKSSSHDLNSAYGRFDWNWQDCLMRHCVDNWRQCVQDLGAYEAVGCHWLTGQADGTQNYFAGTFFWARASFLRTLPSIFQRERIKMSGIASAESKYEAEVWIGNGARLPVVRDYHPGPIAH
jgi:hypothetical protein